MTKQVNKRKNYFIKKGFQTNFILKFCVLVVLGSVISGLILYLFSRGTVTTAFVNSRLSIVSTANYILPALIGSGLVAIVLISIATAFVVMYLSHRIAGPLFKIEKSINEIGSGDLTLKIKLRSADEITRTAERLNEMTENIRKNLLEINRKSDELGGGMDNLAALCRENPSLPREIQDVSKGLSVKKEELAQAIDYFKLKE